MHYIVYHIDSIIYPVYSVCTLVLFSSTLLLFILGVTQWCDPELLIWIQEMNTFHSSLLFYTILLYSSIFHASCLYSTLLCSLFTLFDASLVNTSLLHSVLQDQDFIFISHMHRYTSTTGSEMKPDSVLGMQFGVREKKLG